MWKSCYKVQNHVILDNDKASLQDPQSTSPNLFVLCGARSITNLSSHIETVGAKYRLCVPSASRVRKIGATSVALHLGDSATPQYSLDWQWRWENVTVAFFLLQLFAIKKHVTDSSLHLHRENIFTPAAWETEFASISSTTSPEPWAQQMLFHLRRWIQNLRPWGQRFMPWRKSIPTNVELTILWKNFLQNLEEYLPENERGQAL